MLRDHATELRNLARRASRGAATSLPTPCIVALTGGREGVGVTTLAVNLAVALTDAGSRVVVVDANLRHGDLARAYGVQPQGGLGDILSARRDVHEVLVAGPAGIHILPSSSDSATMVPDELRASQRLWRQIKALGRHAEVVLLDSGSGPGPHLHGIWNAADLTILITTAENESVMETYATVKQEVVGDSRLQLVVNRAANWPQAEDVHRRLARTSQRFLARQLDLLGYIPTELYLGQRAGCVQPIVMEHPESPGSLAIAQLAENLQPLLIHRNLEQMAHH